MTTNDFEPLLLQEISTYYKQGQHDAQAVLDRLEKELLLDKEEKSLPIYSIKSRIKTEPSLYLKIKSKEDPEYTVNNITDLGGMRIICLVEQHIFHIHHYIITELIPSLNQYEKNIDKQNYHLKEFLPFNWNTKNEKFLIDIVKKYYGENLTPERARPTSGYRSVHYIIKDNRLGTSIELQLRTLLQDAWSELEHSLAYKSGDINPHIRKSFDLLAADLHTNDMLIKHLYSTAEKDKVSYLARKKVVPPTEFFYYSGNTKPDVFDNDTALKNMRDTYFAKIKDMLKSNKNSSSVSAAKDQLTAIKKYITEKHADKRLDYFMDMEDAYFAFLLGDISHAIETYDSFIEQNEAAEENTLGYAIYFRQGEAAYILGDKYKALIAFDKATHLCEQSIREHSSNEHVIRKDLYILKRKKAHVYWGMGKKYYHLSLKEISEASELFFDYTPLFSKENMQNRTKELINDLCWYYLENYLLIHNNDKKQAEAKNYLDQAEENYKKLIEYQNHSNFTLTNIDTCAWFMYAKYKYDGDIQYLEQAKIYCEQMPKFGITRQIKSESFLYDGLEKIHYEKIMYMWANIKP